MTPTTHYDEDNGLWLAFSGGGLRASLFHLGVLIRLREFGLLPHTKAVSGASGGSLFAMHWAASRYPGCESDDADGWSAFQSQLLETARRGLLGHLSLLWSAYLLYAVSLAIALFGGYTPWILPSLATGLAAHLTLGLRLGLSRRNHIPPIPRVEPWDTPDPYTQILHAYRPRFLLLRSLVLPSALYELSLNRSLYHGKLMGDLEPHPRVFVTATDLSLGRQFVFSRNVAGTASDSLVRQYLGYASFACKCDRASVAAIVAATTSFPPVLGPTRLSNYQRGRYRQPWVMGDGGLVDNAALNVPISLLAQLPSHIDAEVHAVLAFDATKLPKSGRPPALGWLGAWLGLRRVILNDQATWLATALPQMRNAGIYTRVVAMSHRWISSAFLPRTEAEMVLKWDLDGETIDLIGKVRTSIGRFSETECLTIAYLGYLSADSSVRQMLDHRTVADILGYWKGTEEVQIGETFQGTRAVDAPRQDILEFLAKDLPGAERHPPRMKRHLQGSRWSVPLVRTVARLISK